MNTFVLEQHSADALLLDHVVVQEHLEEGPSHHGLRAASIYQLVWTQVHAT